MCSDDQISGDTQHERELIRRSRLGDEQAFSQLVSQNAPSLYRVVRRMASDISEAEAIVQEAFFRAWKSLPGYVEDRPFFPYLVTIAVNLGRDQWRKSRFVDFTGLEPVVESLPATEPTPETQMEETEQLQALAEAVAGLPIAYRAVIALRYDAGMDYREIAEMLGLPVNTVRTHLHRAKAYLRQKLELSEDYHG